MYKLNPLRFDKIWGYENWLASTHPDGCQQDFSKIAKDYPLIVKVIQANDTLSVQVHPDDKKAVELEGSGARGKTECWYILDAQPSSKLVYGLNKNYSPQELKKAIDEKKIEGCLNIVTVKKGDFIFIPSGTVHAIGGGLRLLEVQQSCNITYRFYDWNRPRELHVEKGLASIKNDCLLNISQMPQSFKCQYFQLDKINVRAEEEFSQKNEENKIMLLFIADGCGSISSSDKNFSFQKEEIFALLSGENVLVKGNCQIIKIQAL